jgi:hypothetical protein
MSGAGGAADRAVKGAFTTLNVAKGSFTALNVAKGSFTADGVAVWA